MPTSDPTPPRTATRKTARLVSIAALGAAAVALVVMNSAAASAIGGAWLARLRGVDFDRAVHFNAVRSLVEGRKTFRYDTFGDQDFWGGRLRLHQAIAGADHGGVGPGVSPRQALAVGL